MNQIRDVASREREREKDAPLYDFKREAPAKKDAPLRKSERDGRKIRKEIK